MNKDYPAYRKHLQLMMGRLKKRIPTTLSSFSQLHTESMKEGSLSVKQKELIALAIGISTRCDGCITFHTYEALSAGATSEEISETIGVAVMMGGGPSLMYAAHAQEALEQFQTATESA